MSSTLNELDPSFRPYAEFILAALKAQDPSYHATSTRRSKASQARLYAAYRAGTAKFPAAPPGCSKHERGWAVDIVSQRRDPYSDPILHAVGRWWRSKGGEWGESDPIHFALPGRICA